MPTVELIYDSDCPNVERARANLLRAFAEVGLTPRWQEWDRSDPESPVPVRAYGSPTVLVDGKDVADAPPSGADCCRLYRDGKGRFQGAPSVGMIAAALGRSQGANPEGHRGQGGWRSLLAVVPATGVALLPRFT
jgi:hypothetical protein